MQMERDSNKGQRVDPRSWLVLLLAANLSVFAAVGVAPAIASAACAAAALFYARAVRLATTWLLIATICALCWLVLPVVVADSQLLSTSPIAANAAGILALVGTITLRFGSVAATAGAFLAATRVSALTAALGRMKVPRVIIIPLGVTFRFLPVIRGEYTHIVDAMQMRGIQPGPGSLVRHPLQTVIHIVVPLVSATLRAADDLAASALMRGLGSNPHVTSVQDLRLRSVDVPVITAAVILFILTGLNVAGVLA